ncbi:MAG: cysteine desulfurase family protein [Thermoanaerobaculia bacterium]
MSGAYFDHNATTPLDPVVRTAMERWMGPSWGNPSSVHRHGQAAREAVEEARASVARAIGASSPEIVFGASGTECNNAVVAGAMRAAPGGRVVVSALEHPSILHAVESWAPATGTEVVVVPPDASGVVRAEAFVAALASGARLAALMLANNEIGTIQPVAEVAAACRERGVPLLVDAVQALGKIPVRVQELGADYLTVAAHKLHGPLGAAALFVRTGAPFVPFLVGGSQERQRRASTVNVPAVVGFGVACERILIDGERRFERLAALRDRFEEGLARIPGSIVHGAGAPRLPHTTHVAFPGLVGQELMIRLDLAGWAVSTGAACGSGTVTPSATLLAMGLSPAEAIASLRVSFGVPNTMDEIDRFLPELAASVAALRAASPGRAEPAPAVAVR